MLLPNLFFHQPMQNHPRQGEPHGRLVGDGFGLVAATGEGDGGEQVADSRGQPCGELQCGGNH